MSTVTASISGASCSLTANASARRNGAQVIVSIPWSTTGSGYYGRARINGATVFSKYGGSTAWADFVGSGTYTLTYNNHPGAGSFSIGIDARVQAQSSGTQGNASGSVSCSIGAAEFTLTFDAAGGETPTPTKTVTWGQTYGELPAPVRDGWKFLGWFTEAEAGEEITAEGTVAITADTTLYAHWAEDAFSGVYSAQNGALRQIKEAHIVEGGTVTRLAKAYAVQDGVVSQL